MELTVEQTIRIVQTRRVFGIFRRRLEYREEIVTDPKIQHQVRPYAPIVLNEETEIVAMACVAIGPEDVHDAVGHAGKKIRLVRIPDTNVLNVKPARISCREDTA